MATSNSYDFSISTTQIIDDAHEICGLYTAGETLPSDDFAIALRKLNMMVKMWAAKGHHICGIVDATLFLVKDTASYSLGSTGTHCTSSYVKTTLSTAEETSSTSLGLTAFAGMSASDNIGIVLDDGTIHWTTISGAPGSTTTIATGLASAAASGNVVFTYTSKIQRPLRIVEGTVFRRDKSDNDTPLNITSRRDYAMISDKTSSGKSNQWWYDQTLTNGTIRIWPVHDLVTDVIKFGAEILFQDFDVAADTPDFPIEWGEVISYGLADRIAAGSNAVSGNDKARIHALAEQKIEEAWMFNREDGSVFFQPEVR